MDGSQRSQGSHEFGRVSGESVGRRPLTAGGAPATTLKGEPALREGMM